MDPSPIENAPKVGAAFKKATVCPYERAGHPPQVGGGVALNRLVVHDFTYGMNIAVQPIRSAVTEIVQKLQKSFDTAHRGG
jgi:hypothetical protein